MAHLRMVISSKGAKGGSKLLKVSLEGTSRYNKMVMFCLTLVDNFFASILEIQLFWLFWALKVFILNRLFFNKKISEIQKSSFLMKIVHNNVKIILY